MAPSRRISIAILALGGQGGGVLADWILDIGQHNGWRTQGTSVPGVAQRTGSTVYYIEIYPEHDGPDPVLSLSPVPGDVDVVLASELMETGRAILRGFVSKDRTTLIGSTHRIYAISEKSAMGNGLNNSGRIIEAAHERARRFVGFDMDDATARTGSVISSVMLGALAGSGALPFGREAFEAAIRASGIAVDSNLRGFEAGFVGAQGQVALPAALHHGRPQPTTAAGRALADRVAAQLPLSAQVLALHGVQRLMDYQDADYAALYMDRLEAVRRVDTGLGEHALTATVARYLALWMAYDDTIRVADLKTRASRVTRVRGEIRVDEDQLIAITEFMHPRLREVCETMPAWAGRFILASPKLVRLLDPMFQAGRHVETTSLRWFLMLRFLASLRRWRRSTLRYQEEDHRIAAWLALVTDAAAADPAAAVELAECQRLIKGYGDTFERGLRSYGMIAAAYQRLRGKPDAAATIRALRDAALEDEDGTALVAMVNQTDRAA